MYCNAYERLRASEIEVNEVSRLFERSELDQGEYIKLFEKLKAGVVAPQINFKPRVHSNPLPLRDFFDLFLNVGDELVGSQQRILSLAEEAGIRFVLTYDNKLIEGSDILVSRILANVGRFAQLYCRVNRIEPTFPSLSITGGVEVINNVIPFFLRLAQDGPDGLPCPLLNEIGNCSVYMYRPMVCAGSGVFDLKQISLSGCPVNAETIMWDNYRPPEVTVRQSLNDFHKDNRGDALPLTFYMVAKAEGLLG